MASPDNTTMSDSEEETFDYTKETQDTIQDVQDHHNHESEEEEHFVYPDASTDTQQIGEATSSRQVLPSPAQLESLYAAATSGDLPLLKILFKNALDAGDVEPFSLANDASIRTGFTALHAAVSKGHYDVVVWCTYFAARSNSHS